VTVLVVTFSPQIGCDSVTALAAFHVLRFSSFSRVYNYLRESLDYTVRFANAAWNPEVIYFGRHGFKVSRTPGARHDKQLIAMVLPCSGKFKSE